MADDVPQSSPEATAKGGLFTSRLDPSLLDTSQVVDPNTRALLSGFFWATSFGGDQPATTIPYAFPTSPTDFTSVPGGYAGSVPPDPPDPNWRDPLTGFAPLTPDQENAVRTSFALISSYTNLTFNEAPSGLAADAAIRVIRNSEGGSSAFYPADGRTAGDTFLGSNGNAPPDFFGTDHFNTIMHELGHALGLKHGHPETGEAFSLEPQFDNNEFSVMTYRSYFGADPSGATEARLGSSPQSYMMFDIAALQFHYGANFSKVGTTAEYTWDASTGQQLINGSPAPDTGVTATNKIFSTVWTMGAVATFNLSNFNQDQVDDLRPGHWLRFSDSQLADLNSLEPAGTPQFQAQGNVYNALLYNGDTRSEISNLITGSGNDTVWGNDLNNILNTGAGNDTINASPGDDTYIGGPGADTIHFGSGHSFLRDALADLNGDVISGLAFTNAVDILGVLIDASSLSISPGTATVSAGGSSFQLIGDFANGAFMGVGRGSGADASTVVSFVNFLPSLSEGVSVDPGLINGIVNPSFLTGDGSAGFMVSLNAAVSAYSNTVGFYTVGADGTIGNVHVLFSNTLDQTADSNNVSSVFASLLAAAFSINLPSSTAGEQTIDLGVPGDNQRIGFFLIQNGFNAYGTLPDNLSFVAPGTGNPADLDTGAPPVLFSATLGMLVSVPVFHSFADLNPSGANQVLSGVAAGGHELLVGFEDLPTATGDNDFQDVVLGIDLTQHDFLIA